MKKILLTMLLAAAITYLGVKSWDWEEICKSEITSAVAEER